MSESASTSSIGSNSSHSKAPGSQLTHGQNKNISSILNYTAQMQFGLCGQEYNNDIAKQMLSLDNDSMLGTMDKEQKRLCLSYGLGTQGKFMNSSFTKSVENIVGEHLRYILFIQLLLNKKLLICTSVSNCLAVSMMVSFLKF